MKFGVKGFEIIKKWERGPKGESPCLYSYVCPAGKWTIGWGHTKGVRHGMTCTVEQAIYWLSKDVQWAQDCVNECVKVTLTQNQFDALVCLVFNVGSDNFAGSTMLKLLNQGKYAEAAREFSRWVHSKGKKMQGLVARRADEEALFNAQ